MKLKCLIVDDEHIARKILSDYVDKVPELELVATCNSALQALKHIKQGGIDILLLDIQMPDLSGLDFLKILPNKPATILTTAYSEYAVHSYELDVVDYLLKPIDFERFYKAITKVISTKNSKGNYSSNTSSPLQTDKLFIKADSKIISIAFHDIIVINGQGPYVQIITVQGRKIMSLQSMSKLEELLPPNFYRIHRSHIVNINHIDSIDGNMVRLKDHTAIISKNKRDEFLKLIDQLNLLGD
ncbi:response regulator transcription factor [Winogradskyella echinorum]|uniref:Response regulator transcription factor n=1 Tax=Winogradskyella echinorum TaxID=538189 RepID=A0ABR6Y0Y4_9FLAO|nr:LytTR family DNA-binding domain-containing protein [Winogradskyella echinorum]MBC3846299.1 response regulator transcription factor [Winogradskyella echinorum]MBC5750647.1 response regulator transcription factor [Winogradskyella echinorum]